MELEKEELAQVKKAEGLERKRAKETATKKKIVAEKRSARGVGSAARLQ